jgi:hypothetical protein
MRGIAWLMLLLACSSASEGPLRIPANDPRIRYVGAVFPDGPGQVGFAWTGVSIRFRFEGDSLSLCLQNLPRPEEPWKQSYYHLELDGQPLPLLATGPGDSLFRLGGWGPGPHELLIFRRSEALTGQGRFAGLVLPPGGRLLEPPLPSARCLEFLGNSITCGYGNEGSEASCDFDPVQENGYQTYAARAARALRADFQAVCYSGRGVWRNYGDSPEPLMGQLFRQAHPWEGSPARTFSRPPDALMVNLGTNDFAQGIPPEAEFVEAYAALLADIRQAYPAARIVCLTGSMMQGPSLATLKRFLDEAVERRRAAGDSALYRFDLSPQGELGYGCDAHPSLAQHARNAEELSAFLRTLLGWQD